MDIIIPRSACIFSHAVVLTLLLTMVLSPSTPWQRNQSSSQVAPTQWLAREILGRIIQPPASF